MTTPSTAVSGTRVNQQQGAIAKQQQMTETDIAAVHGVSTGHQILQGSSAGGSTDVRVENAVVQTASVWGGVGASHKSVTTKVCRRCGVKGHLMCECTATVYCEICKSSDHAMSQCPILKQLKPVAHLVGQAADTLAGFHIPHAPI
jgi:hypothetical protein